MDFNLTVLVFCICQILEKKWEYIETVHQLFIDCRSEVLYMLFGYGITIKLIRLIKMCFNETCSRVHVGERLSDMFLVEECRLGVFGLKSDVVTGRRKPHEELHKRYQMFR
jgi:hypothetical protein